MKGLYLAQIQEIGGVFTSLPSISNISLALVIFLPVGTKRDNIKSFSPGSISTLFLEATSDPIDFPSGIIEMPLLFTTFTFAVV